MSVILGISSAYKSVEAALAADGVLLAQSSLKADGGAAEFLIDLIDEVLKGPGNLKKLSAVAVVAGPGSYGGLRGSLAAAKSVSHVLGVPIVPISTLEAAACNLQHYQGSILVALPARQDEFNIALFGSGRGYIKRSTDDFVIEKKGIFEFLSHVSGELYIISDEKTLIEVAALGRSNILTASPSSAIPKAANAALLAEEKLKSGEIENFASALPRYSHAPNIREWKR